MGLLPTLWEIAQALGWALGFSVVYGTISLIVGK
jgi:hypothetical protein